MERIGRKLATAMIAALLWTGATRADAPATQPATPELYAVKKGKLKLEVMAEATLLPLDAQEVRIKPKAYAGAFTVVSAAAPFAQVKKGDSLLELDKKPFIWEMESVTNALALAKASLAKAEADLANGTSADATAMRMWQDSLKNSDASVTWFETVDGPQMLKSAELSLQMQKNGLEDQGDELDQLKKMYKSEDLTNATADIVIKRALRRYEQSKITVKMHEERHGKTVKYDYPIARQRVLDAQEQLRQQFAGVKPAQEVAAIQRKNAVSAARIALEQAQQKFDDLKADEALFAIKAAADGVAVYGNLGEGAWAGGDPKALKAGEKIAPGAIAMRLVTPGKLKLDVPLSELQATWLKEGSKATVSPAAFPVLSYQVTSGAPSAQPRGPSGAFGFQATVNLPAADARLLPGMKASVRIEESAAEALLVPLSFVKEGRVRTKDGEAKVTFGRSDGKDVEVLDGLKEGDVLVKPK